MQMLAVFQEAGIEPLEKTNLKITHCGLTRPYSHLLTRNILKPCLQDLSALSTEEGLKSLVLIDTLWASLVGKVGTRGTPNRPTSWVNTLQKYSFRAVDFIVYRLLRVNQNQDVRVDTRLASQLVIEKPIKPPEFELLITSSFLDCSYSNKSFLTTVA